VTLYLGPYTETLAGETWDALICDPPYSERTHTGHNDGCSTVDRLRDQLERMKSRTEQGLRPTKKAGARTDAQIFRIHKASIALAERQSTMQRRSIEYAAWSPDDARGFIRWAHDRTRGWMVVMCDHVLWPHYIDEMEECGRYAFAPVVWYCSGSRVRMSGDGPACWVTWFAVSRPRNPEFMRWGALPGGYTNAQDHGRTGGDKAHIGGKPLDLMRAIVRDYSRPGDTVCDPCAGWGTTLRAAQETGRLWLGSEMDPHAHSVATKRLAQPYTPPLFDDAHPAQTGIFDGVDR
jgi:hypothetical protein